MVFAKPSDAVQFALLAQRAVRELSRETGQPVLDRVGIHVGEVFIQDRGSERRNLFGIQIDSPARIMSLGNTDQILLSRFAFDNARLVLRGFDMPGIGELSWLNHGYYELKGVEEPLEVCEVGETALAALTAPGDSEKAHRFHAADAEPVLGWRPAAGQVVPNTQWVLDQPLGQGGFGEVWLARHQTLKDRRVFKFCFNAEKARSLKREVTLFRVLREHVGAQPGIVTVHDVFFDQPPFYIVMDYIDGATLTAWAEARGPLDAIPLETRLEIVAQIAEALQTAHDAGVIHRDVKPSNILIQGAAISPSPNETQRAERHAEGAPLSRTAAGMSPLLETVPRAWLTDFGIGQLVSPEAAAGVTQLGFTQTMMDVDSLTGTQLYLAPELLSGHGATIRSDIYALGVVLYQLTVGALNRPLTSDWADDIADPLLREDIRNCIAGDPAKRFAGGAQIAAHLRSLGRRRAEREAETQLTEQLARRRKRMRFAFTAFAALAIAAIVLGTALIRERALRVALVEQSRRAETNEAMALAALGDLKGTAPALFRLAQAEAESQRYEQADDALDAALALDPAYAPGLWQRAWIHLAQQRYSESAAAVRKAAECDSTNSRAPALVRVCEEIAGASSDASRFTAPRIDTLRRDLPLMNGGHVVVALNRQLRLSNEEKFAMVRDTLEAALGKGKAQITLRPDGTIYVDIAKDSSLRSLEPLRGLPIHHLIVSELSRPTLVESLEPIRGLPLLTLNITRSKVSDLGPLTGMPLVEFICEDCPITDLRPLAGARLRKFVASRIRIISCSALMGMPLEEVEMSSTQIADLTPLNGAPIQRLGLRSDAVSDLSPLRGMPLEYLDIGNTRIHDLNALDGLPLKTLIFDTFNDTDLSPLLGVPSLVRLTVSAQNTQLSSLKRHPSLREISVGDNPGKPKSPYLPVAEFWAAYDARQAAGK